MVAVTPRRLACERYVGTDKCICSYQTAIASIRRTSQPYQYEIAIGRGATEEEAELLEEEGADGEQTLFQEGHR